MENMDSDILKLLQNWDLSHMHKRFEEQKITTEVLKMLKPAHISKLLSKFPIGEQAKFEFHLEKWKQNFENDENVGVHNNLNLPSILNVAAKGPQVSVMDILGYTCAGKQILQFYAKHQFLQEDQRNLLISTIAKYIDSKGIMCSISDCSDIENQICSIFTTEQIEFYNNGKRGKIYNKISNLKRQTKDALKSDETPTSASKNLTEPDDHYSLLIQTLRSDTITKEEFDIYWRKCAPYRFQQTKDSKSTSEIFKLWPEYKNPSSTFLIDIDFSLIYPNAKSLKDRWVVFADKLLNVLKAKVSSSSFLKTLADIEQNNEESRILTILWHLHNLFPPQQKIETDQKGSKYRKRFTICDSQQSFVIIAKSKEELEAKLELVKLQGKNVQPMLLIIGEFTKIDSIYVFFNSLKFPFLTILNALDILFKMFFVFNVDFPEESKCFYNFLRSLFYDLPISKKYIKVSTIKHEILKM